MNYVPVIDISEWQGKVDFYRMASLGVRGVYIRGGNGDHFDSRFGTYIPAAQAAGLDVGAYWFCNPKEGTAEDAGKLLASVHNSYGLNLPPMLDVESYAKERGTKPVLMGADYARWLRKLADVAENSSRKPIVYANASFWNPNVGDNTFGDYDLMCARYPFYSINANAAHPVPVNAYEWADWIMKETGSRPQMPMGWANWAGWQFSAGFNKMGPTYGCSSSDLDLNIVREDVYLRWVTGHIPTPPLEPPVDPPIVVTPAVDPVPVEPEPVLENETMINIPVIAGKNETWDSLALKAKQFGIDVAGWQLRGMNEGRLGIQIPKIGEGNQFLIERLYIQPNGRWLFVS